MSRHSRRSISKRSGLSRGKLSSLGEEDNLSTLINTHSNATLPSQHQYQHLHNHVGSSHHQSHNTHLHPPSSSCSLPKIDLKKEYTRFCKLYSSEPLEIVSTPLERASFGRDPTIVDLKHKGLRGVDCIALGKILASDAPIGHLNLSDCLLLPQGFEALLDGLAKNTRLHTLELRGNNIQGAMTCVLAKLLKVNSHLKRLLLEWNCLGVDKDSFFIFCESLPMNSSLEVLDLRNNQLNAEAGLELASALHKNKSIRSLDLRWNSIGVAGAKAIWDALRTNFVLQNIQLCGNFIPDEIVCYIEQCLQHQSEREKLMEEYASRTNLLTRKLQQTEKEYKHELDNMVSVFDAEETELKNALDSATDLARDFEKKLRSESSKTALLTGQIENLKASLQVVAEKEETLRKALDIKEEHTEHLESLYKDELLKLKSIHDGQLQICQDELISVKDEGKKMAVKISRLEEQLKVKTGECQELEDALMAMKKSSCDLKNNFEERIKHERDKWANWRSEVETAEQYEIRQLENELKVIQSTMMEHVRSIEKAKVDAESRVRHLELQLVTVKSNAEDELSKLRNKLHDEHDQVVQNYVNRLNQMKDDKEKMERTIEQLNCTIISLETEKTSLTRQTESAGKRISQLEGELTVKEDKEKLEEEVKRLNAAMREAENEKGIILKQNDSLRKQIIQLEKELADKDSVIFASLSRARNEVKELAGILTDRDREIKQS